MPYEYSIYVGLTFVFNLIVGTGALTLPSIFYDSGWLLSIIIIIALALISYITSTFVIESIACSSAIIKWKHLQRHNRSEVHQIQTVESGSENGTLDDNGSDIEIEEQSLLMSPNVFYSLEKNIEMGEMASIFFNDFGRTIFYICLTTYLYGDLSIYAAAVSKSLRDVFCQSLNITNLTIETQEHTQNTCLENGKLTRLDVYRIFLSAFAVCLGPFAFFNVQKTKYIQIATIIFRWIAFFVMITIAVSRIIRNGPEALPPFANFSGLPALFGACIYSFMCHHSLPGLISPIKDKKNIKTFMFLDYSIICLFYILLALTGIFAFEKLEDLYTLNFVPSSSQSMGFFKIIEYLLVLFPVFTLTASFPVIAITLKNNLQTLFLSRNRIYLYNHGLRRFIFPLLAIGPPIIIVFFTENITNLVGFTGVYAGTFIQYFIPALLVYLARKNCKSLLGNSISNMYQSPFQTNFYIIFVFIWASSCIIMVTVRFVIVE